MRFGNRVLQSLELRIFYLQMMDGSAQFRLARFKRSLQVGKRSLPGSHRRLQGGHARLCGLKLRSGEAPFLNSLPLTIDLSLKRFDLGILCFSMVERAPQLGLARIKRSLQGGKRSLPSSHRSLQGSHARL